MSTFTTADSTLRLLLRNKFMSCVLVIFVSLCLVSLVGPLLVGDAATQSSPAQRLLGPFWLGGDGGLLGTDQQGRPMVFRLILGLRTTLIVGALAVTCGAVIGVLAGLAAGFYGGRVEMLVMRLAEIQMSFPALLLAMTIIATAGGGMVIVVLALGLNSWMVYAILVRSTLLQFRSNDFILATVNLGAKPGRIMFGHLLPNSIPTVMALATLEVARIMLAEATLSFLGFGVQAPTVSLGSILGEGREYMLTHWWVSTFAGLMLALTVLCANLLGNWAQRISDPLGDR